MRSDNKIIRSHRVHRALIDALEPRRMLADFSGTSGADAIIIHFDVAGLHISINGTDHIATTDSVSIACLAGNDTVRLLNLPPLKFVSIDLGSGNNTFTTYNPVTDEGLASNMNGDVFVHGESGIDTMAIDDSDATSAFEDCTLGGPLLGNFFVTLGTGTFNYVDVEVLELNLNRNPNRVELFSKPTTTELTIFGGDGGDIFSFDTNNNFQDGWTVDTTSLFGGADDGLFVDTIEFRDTGGDGQGPLTVSGFTISRGIWGCTYSGFEKQTISGAAWEATDVLNVNGPSSFITDTTVNVLDGTVNLNTVSQNTFVNRRPHTVNVGNGNLSALGGAVTIDLEIPGIVNINDQNAGGPRTFTLSANQLTSPAAVNFTGVEDVNISAGHFNDNISITGSALGTSVGVSGNLGDDNISIGGGDFGNMLSPVAVNGAGGNDIIRFLGTSDADLFAATLRNNSFVTGGLTHSYLNFEAVDIRSGPGGSDLLIQSVPALTLPAISLTNFTGGGGNDLITIGIGNVLVGGNIMVSGSSGNDTLVLDDSSGTSASTYTFDQGNRFFKTFAPAMFTVVRSGFENTILDANGGSNTITVDRTTSALTILSNAGNDTVSVLDSTAPVTVNTGTENTTTAPFGDSIAVNTDFGVAGDTAATVLVEESDTVLSLNVAQSGTFRIAPGGVLNLPFATGSAFTLAGTIDMAGGALLSRAGGPSLASFRTHITRGFNGGGWNGTSTSGAINSSLAAGTSLSDGVGYGLGSQIAPTTIGSFSIAPGDTLVRHTRDGDADLNAQVNLSDFNRLAANFGQSNKQWVNGDSNYDALVNLTDFNPLAGNFGQAVAAPDMFGRQPIGGIGDRDERRETLEELT